MPVFPDSQPPWSQGRTIHAGNAFCQPGNRLGHKDRGGRSDDPSPSTILFFKHFINLIRQGPVVLMDRQGRQGVEGSGKPAKGEKQAFGGRTSMGTDHAEPQGVEFFLLRGRQHLFAPLRRIDQVKGPGGRQVGKGGIQKLGKGEAYFMTGDGFWSRGFRRPRPKGV